MKEGYNSDYEFRDWAHVPSVAVHLISEKIMSIADYVRFGAVSTPWRSASHGNPRGQFCPQLPWLMIPYAPTKREMHGTDDDGMRLFYDMWESKMCCASYRGWLLLSEYRGAELFLLNPLTRARVDLPPFTTPAEHIWGAPARRVDYLFGGIKSSFSITKMTFSSDLDDPNCIVMVFFQRSQAIFYCHVGDKCWTEVVKPPYPTLELHDAVYHNGTFYKLDTDMIASWNLSEHRVQGEYFFKPELRGVSKFFLVGKSGLNPVTVRFIEEEGAAEDNDYARASRQVVEMYHIPDVDRMVVNRINDTSYTTIFFGDNYHYLAVSADDWPESLDGGDIYLEYSFLPNAGNDGGCMYLEYTSMPVSRAFYSIFHRKLDDENSQLLVADIGKKPEFFPTSTSYVVSAKPYLGAGKEACMLLVAMCFCRVEDISFS